MTKLLNYIPDLQLRRESCRTAHQLRAVSTLYHYNRHAERISDTASVGSTASTHICSLCAVRAGVCQSRSL